MTCRLITKMKYFLVLTFTMFTLSDSMPLSSTNVLRVNESSPSTVSNQTSANSSAAGTNPGFSGHRLLRIQAKPRSGYLPVRIKTISIHFRVFTTLEIKHFKHYGKRKKMLITSIFSLFSKMFSAIFDSNLIIYATFKLSSARALNFVEGKFFCGGRK